MQDVGDLLSTLRGAAAAAPAATACLLVLLAVLAAGRWCGLRDIGAPSLVSCRCGKVVIEFPEPQPRYRIGCCCHDCKQKLAWAATRGGPALPAQVLDHTRPLDLVYFANCFRILRGKACLAFYRLREDSATTNCVSTCCNTTLMVDAPFYKEKCVLIQSDAARVETDFSESMRPHLYIALDKWPADKARALPTLATGQTGDPAVVQDAEARKQVFKSFREKCYAPPPEWAVSDGSYYASTFKSILEEAGGAVETIGLVEGAPVE